MKEPLKKKDYVRYMRSKEWQAVRKNFFHVRQPKACAMCGESGMRLDLHHLTYERLGCELLIDLTAICRMCHIMVHAGIDLNKPPPSKSEFKFTQRQLKMLPNSALPLIKWSAGAILSRGNDKGALPPNQFASLTCKALDRPVTPRDARRIRTPFGPFAFWGVRFSFKSRKS